MKWSNFLAAFAAAMILAACGGGGGSSDPQPTPDPVPVPDSADIVTEVPTPTYPVNGAQATVFNQINALRAKVGSGLLAQDAALDKAAEAHFNYIVLNGWLDTHFENPALSGFTGVDPSERAMNAGYAGGASEVMAGALGANRADTCVPTWANSVYHMFALFAPDRDLGIGAGDIPRVGPMQNDYIETYCVLDISKKSQARSQRPVAGTVLTYPYDRQTSVPVLFLNRNEIPQPLPELDGVGQPIAASFATQTSPHPKVTVTSYTVTAQGAGSVAAKVLAAPSVSIAAGVDAVADDQVWPEMVFLVPVSPLTPDTTYAVVFEGTVDGKPVRKSWSFTTEADKG